uniref:Uncharacterized protein n=1 Tax=Heterorhabditis bacteriophora TaxID=37862 RepID=A0A1I7XGC7_HETBA
MNSKNGLFSKKIADQLSAMQKNIKKILKILGKVADGKLCLFCEQENNTTERCGLFIGRNISVLDNVKYVQDTSGATMKWTTSCAAQAHAAVAEETITTLCTTKGQGTPTAAQRNEKECEHHKDIPIDRIHLHHCRPFSYAAAYFL